MPAKSEAQINAEIETMRHACWLIRQAGSRFDRGRGVWEDAHGEIADAPIHEGYGEHNAYPDRRDADLERWEARGLLAGMKWEKTWRPTT